MLNMDNSRCITNEIVLATRISSYILPLKNFTEKEVNKYSNHTTTNAGNLEYSGRGGIGVSNRSFSRSKHSTEMIPTDPVLNFQL